MVLLVRRAEPGDQRSLTSLVSKAGGPTKVIFMCTPTCVFIELGVSGRIARYSYSAVVPQLHIWCRFAPTILRTSSSYEYSFGTYGHNIQSANSTRTESQHWPYRPTCTLLQLLYMRRTRKLASIHTIPMIFSCFDVILPLSHDPVGVVILLTIIGTYHLPFC